MQRLADPAMPSTAWGAVQARRWAASVIAEIRREALFARVIAESFPDLSRSDALRAARSHLDRS